MYYRNETIHFLLLLLLIYNIHSPYSSGLARAADTPVCVTNSPTYSIAISKTHPRVQRHNTNIPMRKHFLLKALLKIRTIIMDI